MSDERGDSLTVRYNNDANKLFTTSDFDLELALGISRLLYVIYSTRKIEMRDNSSLNYILFDLISYSVLENQRIVDIDGDLCFCMDRTEGIGHKQRFVL